MRPANPAGDVLCLPEFELPGVFQSHLHLAPPMTPEYKAKLASYIAALQHILDGGTVKVTFNDGAFHHYARADAPPAFCPSWTYTCLPKPAEAWVVCRVYGGKILADFFAVESRARYELNTYEHDPGTKPWIVHIVEPQT
jgi:hypothetical protein